MQFQISSTFLQCRFFSRLSTLIMVLSSLLLRRVTALPVASIGTPVCDGPWFYGYQSVGAIYTMGDSSSLDQGFAVGGYLKSGCSTLMPLQQFLNNECAIIEIFDSQLADKPSMSVLLGVFPHESGANLAITGIRALSFKKVIQTSFVSQVFGVVQIGSGPASTTDQNLYLPDGTELALFLLREDGRISWFYLDGYFQDYNCGISKTTMDFYRKGSSTYMSFQKCSTPYDNFIIALDLVSLSLLSLTKHPRTEVTKWYAMQTNWKSLNSAFFAGMTTQNLNPTLVWLVAQENQLSTAVSAPKCLFQMELDSNFQSNLHLNTQNYVPAVARFSSITSSYYEGIVVLHPATGDNCIVLIASRGGICESDFDAISYCQKNSQFLVVLDAQVYDDASDTGLKILFYNTNTKEIGLLTDIANSYYRGFYNYGIMPTLTFFSLTSTNAALASQITFAEINQASAFLLKDDSIAPVLLGSKNGLYYQGVTDGFIIRDASGTCLKIVETLKSYTNYFDTIRHHQCLYMWSGSVEPVGYISQTCDSPNSIPTQNPLGQAVALPALKIHEQSVASTWDFQTSYTVRNPCQLTFSMSIAPTSPVTWYLGTASTSKHLYPTFDFACPVSTVSISSLDWGLSLTSQVTSLAPSTLFVTALPYQWGFYYRLLTVTDVLFVGLYNAQFKFFIPGDTNSVASLGQAALSPVVIEVKACTPSVPFSLTSISLSLNIGQLVYFDLSIYFTNGDCAYSTLGDSSWSSSLISYQPELLSLNGWKVSYEVTPPKLQVYVTDNNYAGIQTYNIKYTNYLSQESTVPVLITFVQTGCKGGVSGLTLEGPYTQNILNLTELVIDISAVQNKDCRYKLTLSKITGPVALIQSFMLLTQPTFGPEVTFVFPTTAQGSLSLAALTGTVIQKQTLVGIYQLSLNVQDFTTSATIGSKIFDVNIEDCANVWNPALNLTKVDYRLESQNVVVVPAFVDLSKIKCNTVTVSFREVNGVDLTSVIQATLTDEYLGTAELAIYTDHASFRGSYTVEITCTDNHNILSKIYMPITIKHKCETAIISPYSFEATIRLNGATQLVQAPKFQQDISGCDTYTYNVTMSIISGEATLEWLQFDLSTLKLSVLQLLPNITSQSVVNVTLGGQILGIEWLPSSYASFAVTLLPMSPIFLPTQKETSITELQNTTKVTHFDGFNSTKKNSTVRKTTDPIPLQARIHSISNTGSVIVKFNKLMTIPEIYTNVSQRRLEPDYYETVNLFLALKVKSGIDDLSPNRTKIIMFNLTDFQKTFVSLQVDFFNPAALSPSSIQPDLLQISFIDSQIFVSQTMVYIQNQTMVSYPIPTQLSASEALKIQQLAAAAESGMNTIALVNLIVNIVLSFGLKYLWNFVNLLQFLVFIPRWKLNIPPNALAILGQLKQIALMEFIPTKAITSTVSGWLGMDPDDDSNIMNNMGLMLIVGVGIMVTVVALGVVSCLVQTNYRAYKTYREIRQSIFYNTFLRYIIQSVLKVGLASATTLSLIKWSEFGASTALSVVTALSVLLVMGLSPLIFGFILRKNFKELPKPSMQNAIGTIYLSIKDNQPLALAYSSIFMLRRLSFIGITFGMANTPSLQIHLFAYLNLFYVMYLGLVVPHSSYSITGSELANESIMMFSCYHFILFSGVVDDPIIRTNIGWSLSAFIGLLLIFNVLVILGANLVQLKRKYELWKLKKAAIDSRKLKMKKLAKIIQENSRLDQQAQAERVLKAKAQEQNLLKVEEFSFRQELNRVEQQQELVVLKTKPFDFLQRNSNLNQVMMSPLDYEREEMRQVIAHMERGDGKPFFFQDPQDQAQYSRNYPNPIQANAVPNFQNSLAQKTPVPSHGLAANSQNPVRRTDQMTLQEQLELITLGIKEIAKPSPALVLPTPQTELQPIIQAPAVNDDYPWIDPPSPRILKAERKAIKEIQRRQEDLQRKLKLYTGDYGGRV